MGILSLVNNDNSEEVWTAVQPEYIYSAIKVEHGVKILCRKGTLDEIIDNEDLKSKFQLNIKRKNRWYWSVYFKAIE